MTVTTPHATSQTTLAAECTLEIGGMTCASCVGRVQKALSRTDGVVTAAVNLATETATVTFDPAVVDMDRLTAAVDKAGYTAAPRVTPTGPDEVEPAGSGVDDLDARRDGEIARLKRR